MKKETIANVVLGVVLLALAIQLTFVVSHAVGKDDGINRYTRAALGITW